MDLTTNEKTAIMKKILFSILALATIVGCSTDATEIAPQMPLYTTSFEVEAGTDQSRAIYNDLAFSWEAGDKLYAIQGAAGSVANTIALNEIFDNGVAWFRCPDFAYASQSEHLFHFVYSVNDVTLGYNSAEIAVPATQDGVWRPVLTGTSNTPSTVTHIAGVGLSQQTAALAIRVYSNNKSDALQVKTITVTGEKPFLGSLIGSLDANGKMVYTTNATINTFTTDVSSIALNEKGQYEYLFEVLPVNAGKLTVTLTDFDGRVLTLSTSGEKEFKANTRTAINAAWVPTINYSEITSMYEDTVANGTTGLEPSAIYIRNLNIGGGYGDPQILVNSKAVAYTVEANNTYVVRGVASGEHTVRIAVPQPDGSLKVSSGEQVEVTVVPTINYSARSTYAYNNGTKVLENNFDNRTSILFEGVTISNSDDFTNSKLDLNNIKFVYGSSTATVTSAASSSSPTTVNNNVALGAHSCYVAVPLKANANATVNSAASTIYVTGVPYTISGKGQSSLSGWTNSNTQSYGGYLLLKDKDGSYVQSPNLFYASDACTYQTKVSAWVYKYTGSFTSLTCKLAMSMIPDNGTSYTSTSISGGVSADAGSIAGAVKEHYMTPTLKATSAIRIDVSREKKSGLSAFPTGLYLHEVRVVYSN